MKKILLGLFGLGAVAALGVVAAASTQPDEMHIERTKVVSASAEDVWPYLVDLKRSTEWSPWEELDPDQVSEFSDPSSGVGAWYTWKGDENVGSGRMSIKAVEDGRLVVEDLEFIEPMANLAEVRLAMAPEGDGTKVSWSIRSPNSFLAKVACLFVDMDAMIGADFEKGLDRLAELAEDDARAREEALAEAAQAALDAATAGDDAEAANDDEAATP